MSRTGMSGFDGGGFAIGEVYGVRWWNMRESGRDPVLRGAYSFDWQPGENTALCGHGGGGHYRSRHKVPDEDCGCGFWGYWLPEAAPVTGKDRVMGVIKGWGDDTLIGEKGFRCGVAQIVALCCEKIVQRRVHDAPPVFVQGPPPGVRWQRPEAMDTFRALGGRGTWQVDKDAPLRTEDDLLRQAEIEYRLGDLYRCPVYTTFDAMLAMHPTTKDYLPPPPPPPWEEELTRMTFGSPAEYQAARTRLAQAMAEIPPAVRTLGQTAVSGADALKRLAMRADFTVEMSATVTQQEIDNLRNMLGMGPDS